MDLQIPLLLIIHSSSLKSRGNNVVVSGRLSLQRQISKHHQLPLLLHLRRPSLDTLTLAAKWNVQLDLFHTLRVGDERMVAHASSVRPFARDQIEHRQQKGTHFLAFINAEMILLSEDVWQGPMPQAMNVA